MVQILGAPRFILSSAWSGPWISIIHILSHLRNCDIDLHSFCPIQVGDGRHTSFQQDVRKGNSPLSIRFHRIVSLDLHRHASIRDYILIGLEIESLIYCPVVGGWSRLNGKILLSYYMIFSWLIDQIDLDGCLMWLIHFQSLLLESF